MKELLWSICLCGIPNRLSSELAPRLLVDLCTQAAPYPDVEVLFLFDNQRRSTGAKRQALLEIARGAYVSFVDDDDSVAGHYVQRLRQEIEGYGPDVVGFNMVSYQLHEPGGPELYPGLARYVLDTKQGSGPIHTAVWRRSLALEVPYPYKNYGEDYEWAQQLWPRIRVAKYIDEVLYYWQWRKWIDMSGAPNPDAEVA